MKRKIICLVAILGLLMAGLGVAMTLTASASNLIPTEPVATISEADIPSETTFPVDTEPTEPEVVVIVLDTVVVERVEPTTYDEANSLLDETTKCQETAQMVLDGLIELGYEPDHPAIVMAYAELENRTADVAYYQEKQVEWEEIHKWEVRASDYPIATQVWLYMKEEFGWSDTVCAGIMGNMMAECGGCWTSDLDWDVSSSSGYGMIQWLGGRKQQLFNIYGSSPSIEDQLNFMKDELYGTNGVTKQVTDSQLDAIINADSSEDCAYAFACYFERCGEDNRWVRRDYARRAYDYFVG